MKSISAYVPRIEFRQPAERYVRDALIGPKVEAFFNEQDIEHYWEIPTEKALADSDYRHESRGGVPFSYFYDVLLQDLDKTDGKIRGVGYVITFDDYLVGLSEDSPHEASHCSRSGFHFTTVDLGGEPVLYYLHLDFQKVLKQVRNADFPVKYPAST